MNQLYTHYNSKYAFIALLPVLIMGLITYMVCISYATVNVAERIELEKKLANVRAEVSHLEFQSIALGQDIDMETALALGFSETDSPHYVMRGQSGVFALRSDNE